MPIRRRTCPKFYVDAVFMQRLDPSLGVRVVAVHQSAIDVEDDPQNRPLVTGEHETTLFAVNHRSGTALLQSRTGVPCPFIQHEGYDSAVA
jgi:hypothetical protein